MRERTALDAGDGLWDGDARQACAAKKRPVADAGDGIGDGDARQAFAAFERTAADAGDGIGLTIALGGDGGGYGDAASVGIVTR